MIAEWMVGHSPSRQPRTSGEALEIARRVAHPFSLPQRWVSAWCSGSLSRDWDATKNLAFECRDVATRYGIADDVVFADIMMGSS